MFTITMCRRLPLPLQFLAISLIAASTNALDLGSPLDYAPQTNVACPETELVRVFTPSTQSLNPLEADYVSTRQATVIADAWKDWLGDGSALGYNLSAFNGNFSKVGIGLSGGGYRAAQYGAGVLSGLDARNGSAKDAGTGGLLQVASYLSALSGEWRIITLISTDSKNESSSPYQAAAGLRAPCI